MIRALSGDEILQLARSAARFLIWPPDTDLEDVQQDIALALWKAQLRHTIEHPYTYSLHIARNLRYRRLRRYQQSHQALTEPLTPQHRHTPNDPLLMRRIRASDPYIYEVIRSLQTGNTIRDLCVRLPSESDHAYACRRWRWAKSLVRRCQLLLLASRWKETRSSA